MAKKIKPQIPVELPGPQKEPLLNPGEMPELPQGPEEDPGFLPEEQPIEKPPGEIPPPGENY